MANIVLGCDHNNGADSSWQNTVAKELEKAGNTVEKLSIGPNAFASYSYSSKAKGKIGVFLIAAGLTALCDLYDGNTSFKYAYFGIRGDIGNGISSQNDFDTKGIHKDRHGDCISRSCNSFDGKTYPQINAITKAKCAAVYGGNATEMGQNIVKAMGGEVSSSSDSKSSISTIKSCIQELLYPWNGEVYCFLTGDTMNIGRIPGPTETRLSLIEGDNIYKDSIQLTDIDAQAVNKLIINWNTTQYVLKDDERIKRFGEKKKIIKTSIKSEKDVIDFAYREWNKLLKDSGRTLECKVTGSPDWRIGTWVRVYIPSFNLNGFMYLTKVSHDDNGEWTTGLTLVDYPPDLGTKPSKTTDSNSSDSNSSDSNSSNNSDNNNDSSSGDS